MGGKAAVMKLRPDEGPVGTILGFAHTQNGGGRRSTATQIAHRHFDHGHDGIEGSDAGPEPRQAHIRCKPAFLSHSPLDLELIGLLLETMQGDPAPVGSVGEFVACPRNWRHAYRGMPWRLDAAGWEHGAGGASGARPRRIQLFVSTSIETVRRVMNSTVLACFGIVRSSIFQQVYSVKVQQNLRKSYIS